MTRPDVSDLYPPDPRSWPRRVIPFDDGLACTIRRDETGMYCLQLTRGSRTLYRSIFDTRHVSGVAVTRWGARRTARSLLRAYRAGENYTRPTEEETIR